MVVKINQFANQLINSEICAHFSLNQQKQLVQKTSFMQNKPNFKSNEIDVIACETNVYENPRLGGEVQNEPKRTQFEPKTNPICNTGFQPVDSSISTFNKRCYTTTCGDYPPLGGFKTNPNEPNLNSRFADLSNLRTQSVLVVEGFCEKSLLLKEKSFEGTKISKISRRSLCALWLNNLWKSVKSVVKNSCLCDLVVICQKPDESGINFLPCGLIESIIHSDIKCVIEKNLNLLKIRAYKNDRISF